MKTDADLRRDVEDELAAEPSLDATAIGVAAQDGVITLSGHVGSLSRETGGGMVPPVFKAWALSQPRSTSRLPAAAGSLMKT